MKTETFTDAYIQCALWSSTDGEDNSLDGRGNELAPETRAMMVADCAKFQAENDLTGYPDTNAGHDFWLTRNGHGSGFWENDFGTPEQCKKLTEASKAFGTHDLYIGDDGMIY